MTALVGVLGFIVMLGVLIFIHELGHFLAAKWFGVRVEVFSLGFGGRLLSFRWGETRYQVSWLPLGGYVRMFGDQEPIQGNKDEMARSFSNKPLWQRSLIVLAGPLANLLVLPLMALGVIYATHKEDLATVVGTVVPHSPAAEAGILAGDRIVEVGGIQTRYFRDLLKTVGRAPQKPMSLIVERDGKRRPLTITPRLHRYRDALGVEKTRSVIGITADYRLTEIGLSDPHSPAFLAGLRSWDRIIAVNGVPVKRWEELVREVAKAPAGPHRYRFRRALRYGGAEMRLQGFLPPREAVVTPRKILKEGKTSYYDGIHSSDLFLQDVLKGSPLEKAGLRAGDRLVSLAGKILRVQSDIGMLPRQDESLPYEVVFEREGRVEKRKFKLFAMVWVDPLKQKHRRVMLGHILGQPYAAGEPIAVASRWRYALGRAWDDIWQITGLLVSVLQKMFVREISTEAIGGPIMIFQIAQDAVKSGWEVFLRHMALISINLGILNLLPIPILDGGHLFFFMIEGVIRRPIPARFREIALLLGLILLFLLMFIGFKNDILRTFFS
jgi:regulator of sigma E protease